MAIFTPPKPKRELQPPLIMGTLKGLVHQSINDMAGSIYEIDLTIEMLADGIHKLQPMHPGRIAIMFTKHRQVKSKGSYVYDIEPVVGKMVLTVSGTWRFFILGKSDRYKKLSDLRVGQKRKTDARVRKLIDKVEGLLVRRADLVGLMSSFRLQGPGKMLAAKTTCDDASEYFNTVDPDEDIV